MAENFVTDIKESGSYCGDGEIYEFLKGSQGFFDWNNRHYQVEETALKTDDYIQGYMLTVVDITKIMEQNRLMKELVLQQRMQTVQRPILCRICRMRSARR